MNKILTGNGCLLFTPDPNTYPGSPRPNGFPTITSSYDRLDIVLYLLDKLIKPFKNDKFTVPIPHVKIWARTCRAIYREQSYQNRTE